MKFADITGHAKNLESLRMLVDSGHLPHAILLSGPSGIGKMNTARALAQYIHCHNRHDGDSCGNCPACRMHEKLSQPDLRFIFPVVKKAKPKKETSEDYYDIWHNFLAENPTVPFERWLEEMEAGNSQPAIFVAESQNIINVSALSPYSEQYKIFIIWLPEKMNVDTANKLLKILEEPFSDTLFILVSNEPQNILPTIFSRTVRFQFNRLRDEEVAQYIMRNGISADEAQEAARLAQGSLTNAITFCQHSSEEKEFRQLFQGIMRAAYIRNVAQLRDISFAINDFGREKSRRCLAYFNHQLRENYIYNMGVPQLNLMTSEDEKFSTRFAPFIHGGNIASMMQEIDKASEDISRNANGKIVLFDLMLKLTTLIRTAKKS